MGFPLALPNGSTACGPTWSWTRPRQGKPGGHSHASQDLRVQRTPGSRAPRMEPKTLRARVSGGAGLPLGYQSVQDEDKASTIFQTMVEAPRRLGKQGAGRGHRLLAVSPCPRLSLKAPEDLTNPVTDTWRRRGHVAVSTTERGCFPSRTPHAPRGIPFLY